MSNYITTGLVRFSYLHVFKPYNSNAKTQVENDPEARYSVTVLLPKTDLATKAAIDAAIVQATQDGIAGVWGGRQPAMVFSPIWDGDKVRQNGEPFPEEYKGHWVFTAKAKPSRKPGVVDANLNDILDPAQIKSGDYGRVQISFYPYSSAQRKGIGCGLEHLQFLKVGEALGVERSKPQDAFATPLAGVQTDDLPFQSMSDGLDFMR